jgi:hypothetical protein
MKEISSNWSDTLQSYLSCSNEDERVIDFFKSKIVRNLRRYSSIEWLEIGPGPGSKTFGLYEAMIESGLRICRPCALEPDPSWKPEFNRIATIFRSRYPTTIGFTIRREALGALLNPAVELKIPVPNLITCIHVLYDKEIIEQFGLYIRTLLSMNMPFTAFVVVESEESDFYKLRQQLAAEGFQVPASASLIISDTLSRLGIGYETNIIGEQFCLLDPQALASWFLPFLLGVTDLQFSHYTDAEKHVLISKIENYLLQRPSKSLDVPDIAFIVESR